MGLQMSDKDEKELRSYLEIIKKYSSLVEKKMNACQGGVGTAQSKPKYSKVNKNADLEALIRSKFKK